MNSAIYHSSVKAEIYRILSECYKEPCLEFAQDVALGYLLKELENHFGSLGLTIPLEDLKMQKQRKGESPSSIVGGGGATDVLLLLKEVYYPLFVVPSPSFALPVESVYKEWAKDGSRLAPPDLRGMLMGDPAIDMQRRYKDAGIEIPMEYKDMPDHLTLLLEYAAFLCDAQIEEEQRAESSVGRGRLHLASPMEGDGRSPIIEEQAHFIEDHLDWLPELHRLIYASTEQQLGSPDSQFYRTVADVTVAFVAYERETYLREERA